MKQTKASKGLTKGLPRGMAADKAIALKISKGAVRDQLPVAKDRRPGVKDFNAKVVGHARRQGDG
jgi:hypothetical protein